MRPGVDFSPWSEQKLARAVELAREIESTLESYVSGYPLLGVQHSAADGRTTEVRLRVVVPPPTDRVALLLGDLVHNLRASLDAAVYAIAHLEDPQPLKPNLIDLPVVAAAKDWPAAVKKSLGEVPREVHPRLEALQPFAIIPGELSGLALLHKLDIEDKHRKALRVLPGGVRAEVSQKFRIDPKDLLTREPGVPDFHFDMVDPSELSMTEGSTVARMATSVPIQSHYADGEVIAVISPNWELELDPTPTLLGPTIDSLIGWTRGALFTIYGHADAIVRMALVAVDETAPPAN